MKGITRTFIGIGSVSAVVTGIGLGISYGLPDQNVSHRDIRQIVNGGNVKRVWFGQDTSSGYGGYTAAAGTWKNSLGNSLMRETTYGTSEAILNEALPYIGSKDEPIPNFLTGEARVSFLRMEAITSLDLFATGDTTPYYSFKREESEPEKIKLSIQYALKPTAWSETMPDAILGPSNKPLTIDVELDYKRYGNFVEMVRNAINESINQKSIEDSVDYIPVKFIVEGVYTDHSINNIDVLKSQLPNVATLRYKVDTSLSWVDSNGKKTKYKIVPEDFYYSAMRTGMSNIQWLNQPQSNDNPFGGWGNIKMINENDWEDSNMLHTEEQEQIREVYELVNAAGDTSRTEQSVGYSNDYLYSLFGMKNLTYAVQQSASNTPNMLRYDGYVTQDLDKTSAHTPEEVISIIDGIKKTVANNTSLLAAPSQYIKEVSSKIDTISFNNKSATVLPGNAKDFGLFTYGQKYDDLLYSGSYYLSKETSRILKIVQNSEYWDKKWVDNKHTVRSYTLEYVQATDPNIFAQSSLVQYENDRIYKTLFADQSESKQLEIRRNAEKYGLHFQKGHSAYKTIGDWFSTEFPQGTSLLSDPMAQLMYGVTTSTINDPAILFSPVKSYATWGLSMRSLLEASINWYGIVEDNQKGTREQWMTKAAPDALIGGSDKDTSITQVIYDYKTELNSQFGYLVDAQGNLTSNTTQIITPSEQKAHYIKYAASDLNKALLAPNFDEIKSAIGSLLDNFIAAEGLPADAKFSFPLVLRNPDSPDLRITKVKKQAEILNKLDSRLEVTIKAPNPAFTDYSSMFFGQSLGTASGWSVDYEGIGSFITGINGSSANLDTLVAQLMKLSADAKKKNSSVSTPIEDLFPQLLEYGKFKEAKYTGWRNGLTADVQNIFINYEDLSDIDNASFSANKLNNLVVDKVKFKSATEAVQNQVLAKQTELSWRIALWDREFQQANTNDDLAQTLIQINGLLGIPVQAFQQWISNRARPPVVLIQNYMLFQKGPTLSEFFADVIIDPIVPYSTTKGGA